MAQDLTTLIGNLVGAGHVVVIASQSLQPAAVEPDAARRSAKDDQSPQPVAPKRHARRSVQRNVGPWIEVANHDHRRRAAAFGVAHVRGCDRDDVSLQESFDFYLEHEELVKAAVRAYHQLRKRLRRGDYVPRASYWDAAFMATVLDDLGSVDEVADFATRWAAMDWTLDSIGVVKNDVSSTVDVFQKMFRFHRNPLSGTGA